MIDLLVILAAVLFGLIVQKALTFKSKEEPKQLSSHKLHSWVTAATSQLGEEYLVCSVCHKKAGT